MGQQVACKPPLACGTEGAAHRAADLYSSGREQGQQCVSRTYSSGREQGHQCVSRAYNSKTAEDKGQRAGGGSYDVVCRTIAGRHQATCTGHPSLAPATTARSVYHAPQDPTPTTLNLRPVPATWMDLGQTSHHQPSPLGPNRPPHWDDTLAIVVTSPLPHIPLTTCPPYAEQGHRPPPPFCPALPVMTRMP